MMLILCLSLLLLSSAAPIFLPKKDKLLITSTQSLLVILIGVATFYAFYQPQNFHYFWQFLEFNHIKLTLSVQFDMLTRIMMIFILVIGFFIYSYAEKYLESDETRIRFLSQFNLVLSSVLLLVMAANLLTAFVAWQLIGINLYLLLNHYHHDHKANRAAKKKFVINRIGDCSFLLAIILAYRTDSSASFAAIQLSPHAELICGLLFISVMTKCAQFPFHIWLIDTMETPTPVSALMHAGVINAGGILLTRVSASLATFPSLTYVILLVGLTSAIFSIQWMNQQPDIKKKLAYSTMGQMGYMLTQCSLGAFPAAIFHLMSHGFYKASLFLNGGETLQEVAKNAGQAVSYRTFFKSLLVALIILFIGIGLFKGQSLHIPLLMYGFILLTLTTLILNTHELVKPRWPIYMVYYLIISLLFFLYLGSFALFSQLLRQYEYPYTISPSIQAIVLIILGIGQLLLWTKNPTLQSLRLKDYSEVFFRRFLLNPLRSIGNVINIYRYDKATQLLYVAMLAFTVISLVYGLTYHNIIAEPHASANNWLVFLFLSIGIVALIVANRCFSMRSLLLYLILFELAFTNIAWFDGNSQIAKIGLFHLINVGAVLFMLALLAKQNVTPQGVASNASNRFPKRVFYLTFSLLLLIGIPGTASFISEFYLLSALMNGQLLFVLLYVSLIILVAIVIMHSLQLYVFNKNHAALLSSPLKKQDHWIFLAVIGLNIGCGVHPSFLLSHL
jgi:NADH:ubiquinone oxidoreductase subunit 5 (subunit L)/multisubunit Na+/H+ antiporter MnhA subunit